MSESPVANLCVEFFDWRLREFPEFATFCGFHQYDDRLNVFTEAAFEKRGKDVEAFLEKVKRVEAQKTRWVEGDELSLQLLKSDLSLFLNGVKLRGYLFAINYAEGLHTDFEQLASWMLFRNVNDYQVYVKRLKAVPKRLSDDEELLRVGVSSGIVANKLSMEGVMDSLRGLDKSAEDTVVYRPFNTVDTGISENELKPVRKEAIAVIRDEVIPAFRRLATYIEKEYISACRSEESISGVPRGAELYLQCLKFHTSVDHTPDEIHQTGLKEVARIKAEMEQVIGTVGFNGSLKEFIQHLRTEEKFYYKSKDRVDAAFKKQYANGLYLAGTLDGSRPGTFYANGNNLRYCPKYEMMALSLHEGEPGHHLQSMYAVEAERAPAFRKYKEDMYYTMAPSRFLLDTAYIEGWGLYCENLGQEMGLYDDPYALFGKLSFEMHRACRLVVDTGLHAFGWSDEKAVQYVLSATALGEPAVRNEVRRYVTFPGQACAYKIGQMKIQELREKAVKDLGDKFDVREFHREVLECLAVPLPVLESVIQKYIDRVKKQ